ncbi:hypothetical protein BCR33DRAFT_716349, partial [Rhizoclosmatium globosum]
NCIPLNAYNLTSDTGKLPTGHWDETVINIEAVTHCKYAVRVKGTPTCNQLAEEIGMSPKAFQAINNKLDCTRPFILPNTMICVPFDPTGADEPSSPKDGDVNNNGTLSVNGTLIGNSTTPLNATTTTTALPSPTTPPHPFVDKANCKALFDMARSQYNPAVGALTWSDNLAGLAQYSADLSASTGCCDETCHTLSGGGTGISQNLYCGQTSCADAYDGWVTQEASWQGGHWRTTVGWPVDYPYFGCAVSTDGVMAIVCNFSWYP